MARIHLDRIKKRYGYTSEKYKALMEKIIANNSQRIHNSVNQVNKETLDKTMSKITTKEKILNLPETLEMVKPQSIWSRKGAERGKLLTEELRKMLDRDIKAVLKKPEFITRTGKLTGQLKKEAILEMYSRVQKTFENYTKVDPTIGVPKNIKAIATTEVRPVVNQANAEYMDKLLRKNPDIEILKKWIHNGNVWGSKTYKPRKPHVKLHGKTVKNSDNFIINDKDTDSIFSVPYPHHESLPADQVISCNCSVQYIVRKLKKG